MKTFLMFILIVGNLFAITAEDAAWQLNAQTDLNKAYEKAKAQKKKLVFLLVVKDGCHWCEMMVQKTLRDAKIQKSLEEMVTVVIDMNGKLPKEFQTKLTPGMFFIEVKSKTSVLKDFGYLKTDSFLIDIVSASEIVE